MENERKDESSETNRPVESNKSNLGANLEFWMSQLPPFLKTIPVIYLAIPGSHNSMTYTIKRSNEVGPDEPKYLRFLGKHMSLIIKPIIFNWSITENSSISEQLNGGIRYIDLRLATKRDNEVYFVHGLYGDEVTAHLNEIADWLSGHPNEILIIDCQHFYRFSEDHHRRFISKLRSIFNTKMCPSTNLLGKISLDWMIRRKHQVIIIYRNQTAEKQFDLWPSFLWPTPWANTVRTNQLINFLDTKLKNKRPDVGFISQCLLTPDVKYVLKHLLSNLNQELTTSCREAMILWIKRHAPGAGGLNIIIADFISFDQFLFSKTVIQRNELLLR